MSVSHLYPGYMLKSANGLVKSPMHRPQAGSAHTPYWWLQPAVTEVPKIRRHRNDSSSSTPKIRPYTPVQVSLCKFSRVANILTGFCFIAVSLKCRYKSFESKSKPDGILGTFMIKTVDLCQVDIKASWPKGKRHKCLKIKIRL